MCKLIAVGACVPQCATTNLWKHICKKKTQNKNTSYLWASDAQIGGNLLSNDQPPNKGSLCSSHDLQLNFMSLGSKRKYVQQQHGSKRQTKTFSAIQASSKSAWKWCFDVLDGETSKELQPFGRIGHHHWTYFFFDLILPMLFSMFFKSDNVLEPSWTCM